MFRLIGITKMVLWLSVSRQSQTH